MKGKRCSEEQIMRILHQPRRPVRRIPIMSGAMIASMTRPPNGRRLKCLTILDTYAREGLAIYCTQSITAVNAVQVLQRLFAQRGAPGYAKSDNGPECIAQWVTTWLGAQRVDTHFIDPGSPWQNGHNERFNGVFRDRCLDRWLFASVQEARRIIHQWSEEYNNEGPHGALHGLTPAAFTA
jgi:putative transposase